MENHETTRKHLRLPSLVLSIILLVLGILTFVHPGSAIRTIVWFIGLGMGLSGLFSLITFFEARSVSQRNLWWALISGILDLILMVLLWSNASASFVLLGYLFAIWVLSDSINVLQTSWLTRYPGLNTALGVLGLLAGIALLFTPMLGAVYVVYLLGFFAILIGLTSIIRAF